MKTPAGVTRGKLLVIGLIAAIAWCEIRFAQIRHGVQSLESPLDVKQTDADVAELSKFQTIVGDEARWPKDLTEAEQLRDRLEEFTKKLPPMSQDNLLPTLNPVRWSVKSLWTIRRQQSAKALGSDEYAATCQALLDARPDDAPAAVAAVLEAERLAAMKTAGNAARTRAIDDARKAINSGAGTEAAWTLLEPYADDREVADLRRQLRQRIVGEDLKTRSSAFAAQLKQVQSLTEQALRQAAAARLYESAITAKLNLLTEPDGVELAKRHLDPLTKSLEEEMRNQLVHQQAEEGRKQRDYQKWALSQIKEFNRWSYDSAFEDIKAKFSSFKNPEKPIDWEMLRVFPFVRQLLQVKTGVEIKSAVLSVDSQKAIYEAVWGRINWSYGDDLAYRATRDAMIAYLAPIDERFLEPPVQELFRKAFQTGWTKLEGRDDQLAVAEQAAVAIKKIPNDFK